MTTRNLSADVAFAQWVKLNPLTYTVASKFTGDHTLAAPNLSKTTSIVAAIERYKRQQTITTSSWMLVDEQTLKNKAAGATKRASTYKNRYNNLEQQMIVRIKVTRRTVTISRLNRKEAQQYVHTDVAIGGETHSLNCSSAEADVQINVVGSWNPITGAVEMYHYEEKPLPDLHFMVDKYLTWNIDDASGLPISPVAKS